MRRSAITAILTAMLLVCAAYSVAFPAAPVERVRTDHGPTARHVPVDVQIDRDFADVPRTSISSTISLVTPRAVIATVAVEHLIARAFITEHQPVIIEQQHVFRI